MQGNYVKLANPRATDLRKRAIGGLISGSLMLEHHIDFHTTSGVLVTGLTRLRSLSAIAERRYEPHAEVLLLM